MKLIIHIGSPKCGSTYFQRILLNNTEKLAEQGVIYPTPPTEHPGNGAALASITEAELKGMFARGDTVVLSHEDLFAMGPTMTKTSALCAQMGIDVQVLCFLRPFSEFIFGDYSQFIKQKLEIYIQKGRAFEGRTFERFVVDRARALSPAGYLRGWQKQFPANPIALYSHRDIRPALETLLNVTDLDWDVPASASNRSLRMHDCDQIVAGINAGLPDETVRSMYLLALETCTLPDPGKTPERTAWIEAIFGKVNNEIQADFGFKNRRPKRK